jgi:hypothetical protein
VSDVAYETAVEPTAGKTPGSGQCQSRQADQGVPLEEFRRWKDFAERCPNPAEALVWLWCPNGHQWPEEVCSWHLDPPGPSCCGHCANEGLAVITTMTVIGRI